ncbi:hypothetical protein NEUTE1DRAFT_55647 [Neurospora tetrasperma FGSC 2508]|uniref:Uncharacterized protein n=1 Tax=Neurospora tetrasperma (strain FGSC 2508 / ATCC MYA-4615 / P0657) TaxID=510951 RepID=F8MY91_NEUT8|nr:uncharacterized protein NEUTE1DRAFT_55647 [Neurospora tetrasperma FGSC 2508]EGO51573.1 hypothetical protein NEUTE1DRAFT_55647 [Neurospora tetrasperma FGSC 2508]EGZ78434.1 hypothetical protein NEUTE2DRAFT_51742 [Neurospora tetrasperma FGSC 2509]
MYPSSGRQSRLSVWLRFTVLLLAWLSCIPRVGLDATVELTMAIAPAGPRRLLNSIS